MCIVYVGDGCCVAAVVWRYGKESGMTAEERWHVALWKRCPKSGTRLPPDWHPEAANGAHMYGRGGEEW